MKITRQVVNTTIGGLAAALLLAAGVHAQMGQMSCAPGAGGMMQCGMGKPAVAPLSSAPAAKNTLKITAVMASPAKSGDNALDIAVMNAAGKPLASAKVTVQVAMTSMDMGTASPTVQEKGKGHYATTAAFSMAGPWRVTVKVVAPGQKPQTKAFDFMAG